MRDRRVRRVFLGLILAFPLLMAAEARPRESLGTVVLVEALVGAGLVFAARERGRLLARIEPEPQPAGPTFGAPHLGATRARARARSRSRSRSLVS